MVRQHHWLKDMNLSKLWEMVKDRGDWPAAILGVAKSQTWLKRLKRKQALSFLGPELLSPILGFTLSSSSFFFFFLATVLNFSLVIRLKTASHPLWKKMAIRWVDIYHITQFSCSVVSDSLQPHELQHTRPPCPSPTPGVYSNSCPSCQWCHPTISSSVIPFSSHLQSFPASGSFPMSWFFASGGQSIGVLASASVLPLNIQD